MSNKYGSAKIAVIKKIVIILKIVLDIELFFEFIILIRVASY
jgi:hypothetical protein